MFKKVDRRGRVWRAAGPCRRTGRARVCIQDYGLCTHKSSVSSGGRRSESLETILEYFIDDAVELERTGIAFGPGRPHRAALVERDASRRRRRNQVDGNVSARGRRQGGGGAAV